MTSAYTDIHVAGGDTGKPLNLQKRMALITSLLPLAERRWRVLDAGCGAGEYVALLRARGYDALGIEYQAEKVERWLATYPGDDSVKQGDLEHLPLPDASVDAALLNEVLEHVPNEVAALRELFRVLRPGGKLVVLSPNRLFPFETHGYEDRRTGRIIGPSYTFLLPWLPRRLVHRLVRPWARNYHPWELRRLVRSVGFATVSTGYLWQTFENISGRQPRLLGLAAPGLRRLAATLEGTPGLRAFGATQVIVATRAELRK
jgi:SAM-dependent methyltransferase